MAETHPLRVRHVQTIKQIETMTKNELAQHAIALQQRIDNLEANKYVHINEIESLHIRPGELWIGHYDDAFLVIDVKTLFSWIFLS